MSGSADKTAAIWNLASEWKLERTLGTGSHDSPIVDRAAALAFSNDGKQLAVAVANPAAAERSMCLLWPTGKILRTCSRCTATQ